MRSTIALLDDAQVAWVMQRIQKQGVGMETLQADLLDHFCCAIEDLLDQGIGFEEAYQKAYSSICPHGAKEIEGKTVLLLNLLTLTPMKRLLYLSGFGATFSILTVFLLRHVEWHAIAQIFLVVGMVLLLFGVLPSLAYMTWKSAKLMTKTDIFRIASGIVSGVFIGVGMLFKVLLYPGANILVGIGLLMLNVVFLPVFFYQLYKRAGV